MTVYDFSPLHIEPRRPTWWNPSPTYDVRSVDLTHDQVQTIVETDMVAQHVNPESKTMKKARNPERPARETPTGAGPGPGQPAPGTDIPPQRGTPADPGPGGPSRPGELGADGLPKAVNPIDEDARRDEDTRQGRAMRQALDAGPDGTGRNRTRSRGREMRRGNLERAAQYARKAASHLDEHGKGWADDELREIADDDLHEAVKALGDALTELGE